MKKITYQQSERYDSLPPFDEPKWIVDAADYGLAAPLLEGYKFPDQLTLVGTLKPIWAHGNVVGSYHANDQISYASVGLYAAQAALARIEWVAQWVEHSDGGVDSLADVLSFGLDFACQKTNKQAHYHLPSYEHPGYWLETNNTTEPVWSWGGVYHLGCHLADIKQRYFSLLPGEIGYGEIGYGETDCGEMGASKRLHANTLLAFVASINPRYQTLCDDFGDVSANVGVSDEMSAAAIFQPKSLLNHIQFGSIRYFLPDVIDSVGYQSADVVDYEPHSGRLKLLFLRRNYVNTTEKS